MGGKRENSPGPGVDIQGLPVTDPTDNVRLLLEKATKRLDDLRESERRHLTDLMTLRGEYDEKLRDAESKRIDAIRAVDVGAVNRAAEVSATQATTLAAQVATSAETLRTQVAAAAIAATAALAAALEPIQKDIADLRRAQYEAQGVKSNVVERRGASAGVYALGGFIVTLILAAITVLGFIIASKP